jgi:hypothetical protein
MEDTQNVMTTMPKGNAQNPANVEAAATSLSDLPTAILDTLVPGKDGNHDPLHSTLNWNPSQVNNDDFGMALKYLKAAEEASKGLDSNFPRVSQVLRVAQFLVMSEKSMRQFESDKGVDFTGQQREALDASQKKVKPIDIANGPGKNGSDCRAAIMIVQ